MKLPARRTVSEPTRWDPFEETRKIQERLSQLCENYISMGEWKGGKVFMAAVDIKEEGDILVVTTDLPGINKENIEINLKDDMLEKHVHNRKTDEEKIETIKSELEIATEKVLYFDNLIVAANSMRKLAEDKIMQTQSRKLDSLSNKLDSQIQSFGELIGKAETKREEAINKVLDAEVRLIVVENRILHSKLANF